jgi:hypothetical protein
MSREGIVGVPKVIAEVVLRGAVEFAKALAAVLDNACRRRWVCRRAVVWFGGWRLSSD